MPLSSSPRRHTVSGSQLRDTPHPFITRRMPWTGLPRHRQNYSPPRLTSTCFHISSNLITLFLVFSFPTSCFCICSWLSKKTPLLLILKHEREPSCVSGQRHISFTSISVCVRPTSRLHVWPWNFPLILPCQCPSCRFKWTGVSGSLSLYIMILPFSVSHRATRSGHFPLLPLTCVFSAGVKLSGTRLLLLDLGSNQYLYWQNLSFFL